MKGCSLPAAALRQRLEKVPFVCDSGGYRGVFTYSSVGLPRDLRGKFPDMVMVRRRIRLSLISVHIRRRTTPFKTAYPLCLHNIFPLCCPLLVFHDGYGRGTIGIFLPGVQEDR